MEYRLYQYERVLRAIRNDGIRVRHLNKSFLASGCNCHSRFPLIFVGNQGTIRFRLLALSHEYGHCLSIRRGDGLSMREAIFSRFNYIGSKKHAARLLREERRAFRFGFAFLRSSGIAVDDEMLRARRILIGTHISRLLRLQK